MHNDVALVEALLFINTEPMSALSIAEAIGVDVTRADELCAELAQELSDQNQGIQLVALAGGYKLVTHPAFHETLEDYVTNISAKKLSNAALEVLAVIAYGQPITRNALNEIRGVSSDSSLKSLMEKGLIREMGSADTPGNPTLYGTTELFLEQFGLSTLSDLTPLEDFAPSEETQKLIAYRLGDARALSGLTSLESSDTPAIDLDKIADESEQKLSSVYEASDEVMPVVDKIDFDEFEFE